MRATTVVRPPFSGAQLQPLAAQRAQQQYGAVDAALALPAGMTDEAITLMIDPDAAYLEVATSDAFAVRAYHPAVVELWTDSREWMLVYGDPRNEEGMAESARFQAVNLPESTPADEVARRLVDLLAQADADARAEADWPPRIRLNDAIYEAPFQAGPGGPYRTGTWLVTVIEDDGDGKGYLTVASRDVMAAFFDLYVAGDEYD